MIIDIRLKPFLSDCIIKAKVLSVEDDEVDVELLSEKLFQIVSENNAPQGIYSLSAPLIASKNYHDNCIRYKKGDTVSIHKASITQAGCKFCGEQGNYLSTYPNGLPIALCETNGKCADKFESECIAYECAKREEKKSVDID